MRVRLTTFGMGYLIALPVVMIGAGVYNAYCWLDHSVNYSRIQARVVTKRTECAADQTGGGAMQWNSCGSLADATDQRLHAYHMFRRSMLDVRYVSPADGRVQERELRLSDYQALKTFRTVQANDVVELWAHKREPGAVEL